MPHPGVRPPFGARLNGTILVPFPVESCLSGLRNLSNLGDDVPPTHRHMYYRTHIRVETGERDDAILLHFGAVDWQVWLPL